MSSINSSIFGGNATGPQLSMTDFYATGDNRMPRVLGLSRRTKPATASTQATKKKRTSKSKKK